MSWIKFEDLKPVESTYHNPILLLVSDGDNIDIAWFEGGLFCNTECMDFYDIVEDVKYWKYLKSPNEEMQDM